VRYVLLPDSCGFGPVNHTGRKTQKDWIAEAKGGGILVLDYDGDGDEDLFFVDGNSIEGEPYPDAGSRLYRNDGGMRFTDVTEESGIRLNGMGYGGAAADFDNDGDTDIYVCCLGKNHLLRNEGNGKFTDLPDAAGAAGADDDHSTCAAFGDLNGDGWLDLYVANYVDSRRLMEDFRKQGRAGRSCEWRKFKVYCGPQGVPFQKDRLFLSRGDGTFVDATDHLREQEALPAFQPVMADFDGDGDLDVYVVNDTEPNTLWINDGKGWFTEEAKTTGCAYDASVQKQASMGNDVGDYDNDGLMDMIVTNFSHDHYTLYRNTLGTSKPRRDGRRTLGFDDVSVKTGISAATFYPLGWAAVFTDYDNDGWADLFFANGHVYGEIDNFAATGTTNRQTCQLLRNSGGASPVFEDVSAAAGLDRAEVHRGGTAVDLDDDGDEDLVVSALNGQAYILRNDGGNARPWIRFTLRGKAPRDPAGATVRVDAAGAPSRTRIVLRGHSFMASPDPRLLFGLAAAKRADLVTVRWPSGKTQEFRDLPAGTSWLLVEGEADAKRLPK